MKITLLSYELTFGRPVQQVVSIPDRQKQEWDVPDARVALAENSLRNARDTIAGLELQLDKTRQELRHALRKNELAALGLPATDSDVIIEELRKVH